MILWGWVFLVCEAPLHHTIPSPDPGPTKTPGRLSDFRCLLHNARAALAGAFPNFSRPNGPRRARPILLDPHGPLPGVNTRVHSSCALTGRDPPYGTVALLLQRSLEHKDTHRPRVLR